MSNPRGRPKGSTNKRRDTLMEVLRKQFPNYDPVVEMARTANNPEADEALRFNANKEVAQYVHTKLRAVEVTGAEGGPLVAEVILRPHD